MTTEEKKLMQVMAIGAAAHRAAEVAKEKCEEFIRLDKQSDQILAELSNELRIDLLGAKTPVDVMLSIQHADLSERDLNRFTSALIQLRAIMTRMEGLSADIKILREKVQTASRMIDFMNAI